MFYLKFFLILIFLTTFGNAKKEENLSVLFSNGNIANEILLASKKYNINFKMIYTLMSIESAFKPFSIAVETNKKSADILMKLKSKKIKVLRGTTYHSKIAIVSILPDDYHTAKYIIELLKENKFSFDVGLLQINTVNFNKKDTKEMFLPQKNIEKSMKHLSTCFKQFKNTKYRVECYNRGGGNLRRMLRTQKRYFPYYKRYKRHYNSYFK